MGKLAARWRTVTALVLCALLCVIALGYFAVPSAGPALLARLLENRGGRLGECLLQNPSFGTYTVPKCELWMPTGENEARVELANLVVSFGSLRSLPAIVADDVTVELPGPSSSAKESSKPVSPPVLPFERADVRRVKVLYGGAYEATLSDVQITTGAETTRFTANASASRLGNTALTLKDISLEGTLDSSELTVSLKSSAGSSVTLRAEIRYDLLSRAGRLRLENARLGLADPQARPLLPLPSHVELNEGELRLTGMLKWDQDGFAPESLAELSVSDLTGSLGALHFEKLDANGEIALGPTVATRKPAKVRIENIQIGVPLSEIECEVSVNFLTRSASEIKLEKVRAGFMGGILSSEHVSLRAGEASKFVVEARALDLARLLELTGDAVRGTGKLSGSLPITVDGADVTISDGSLDASSAGGELSYHPKEGRGDPTGNAGLDLAYSALEEFHYQSLHAGIQYRPDGTMEARIELYGKNPKLFEGRAIQLNVNVEENIPALLQSVRLATGAGKDVWKEKQ